jgi:hypothetical protein
MPNEIDDMEDIEDDLPINEDEPGLENEDDTIQDDDDISGAAPAGGLTQQQIVELATRAAMANAPQRQQQQLSPEEIDARLNRYKVSEDFIKILRDPEADPKALVAKFQEMLDGAAKFATTSSQLLFQDALTPIQQQVEAQKAFVREQQTKNFVKHVETRFPALQGKQRVVRQAVEQLAASGYVPPINQDGTTNKSAAQKQVAFVAEQMIRQIDPSFRLKSVQNQQRQAGSFGMRRGGSGGGGFPQGKTGAASFLDHLG